MYVECFVECLKDGWMVMMILRLNKSKIIGAFSLLDSIIYGLSLYLKF